MRLMDWLVVIGCGVVGWLLVNYLFSRSKPKDEGEDASPPASPGPTARLPAYERSSAPEAVSSASGGSMSLDEVARTWHTILGVSSDASAAAIERAYHAKLADCDRVRFTADVSETSRRRAEEQRARINQAFEFIRPLR